MVYEYMNCRRPLAEGTTRCAGCGLTFAQPVPPLPAQPPAAADPQNVWDGNDAPVSVRPATAYQPPPPHSQPPQHYQPSYSQPVPPGYPVQSATLPPNLLACVLCSNPDVQKVSGIVAQQTSLARTHTASTIAGRVEAPPY